jgi:hypothetical protein
LLLQRFELLLHAGVLGQFLQDGLGVHVADFLLRLGRERSPPQPHDPHGRKHEASQNARRRVPNTGQCIAEVIAHGVDGTQ